MLPSIISTNVALAALSFLADLVSGEACVTGGPAARVDVAQWCCYSIHGDWFQNYQNQGICVFAEASLAQYNGCFSRRYTTDVYVPTCIQCDETVVSNPFFSLIRKCDSSWTYFWILTLHTLQSANDECVELWIDWLISWAYCSQGKRGGGVGASWAPK